MSDWKTVTLGERAKEITVGFVGPMASEYVGKGIPFLRSQNVIPFSIDYDGIKYISEEFHKKLKKSALTPGDVVIVRTGKPGASAVIPKSLPVVNCSDLVIVRCGDKLDPNFISYYINSITKSHVDANLVGAVQQHFNVGAAKQILIPDIDIVHQRNIASVLSSLDDKIDLLHRQNATLEAMAETLFRQWFVEEAKENWEETTLKKHTEISRGLSYKGSGLTVKGLGLPMHNLNSVNEGGGYKYEGIKFYSGEYRDRHLVNPGDIIVTNTEQGHEFRLIGFPAIVPSSFGKSGIFSQHIYKLEPLSSTYLSNEFIYYLLMTPAVREQIVAATNGSTVNMLAIDGLQRPEFRLPPKVKVAEFTSIVSNHWKKKNNNQSQISTLTALRDTLLPKLMSGEVRVEM